MSCDDNFVARCGKRYPTISLRTSEELHKAFGTVYARVIIDYSPTMAAFVLLNLSKVARLSGNIGLTGYARVIPGLYFTMSRLHGSISLAHLDRTTLRITQKDIPLTAGGSFGTD